MEAEMIDANGRYTRGAGKASLNCGSQYVKVFNCPMIGTFNVRVSFDVLKLKPSIVAFGGHHRYYLVRLNDRYYGWAVRWNGSRLPGTHLEILTKRRLPDSLKIPNEPLKVEVLEPWTKDKTRTWASGVHFFQTFDWTPPERRAANSGLIWDTISKNVEFSKSDVLDIGANFGYHAFRASKAGASVVGQDRAPVIRTARLINDRIESQDVVFVEETPRRTFDYIFYLSVHHQIDAEYARLDATLNDLRTRARLYLFVELISPPISGAMTEKDVDKIVGSEPLLRYRHNVRRTRAIYRVPGGG